MKRFALTILAALIGLCIGPKDSVLGQHAHTRHCGVDYNHRSHHYGSHYHFCPGGPSGHDHGPRRFTPRRVIVPDPTLVAVQEKLVDLGLYHPEHSRVDGIYGKETSGAIRAFQRTRGLPQHGQVDGVLLEALGLTPAPRQPAGPPIPNGGGRILTGGGPTSDRTAPAPENGNKVLTPAEAARVLKVSEKEVLELLEWGELTGKKIGDTWRVTRPAIDDYLKE